MAFNYNGNYGYGGNYPYTPMSYQLYQQQPMAQNMMQQQVSDNPFAEAHFGTIKEAEGHIVAPNKSVAFYNSPLGEIYIKTADNMGNPSLITFKRVNNQPEPQQVQFDPNMFVKRDEFNEFINKNKQTEVITKEDLKDFITKGDLEALYNKIDGSQRKIDIRQIEKGGLTNGSTTK